ncbi:hypothetical protein ACTFIY_005652 [Dictyostelium cf. discoideum]
MGLSITGNKNELIDRIMTNGEVDENGSRSSIEKLYPAAVCDYRNNMGFVDRNNKNTQIMFILNSYLMHKKNDPIDYLKYLQKRCKNLVSILYISHIKNSGTSKKCQCKPNCKFQTRYECQQCDISINPNCFEIYHKLT